MGLGTARPRAEFCNRATVRQNAGVHWWTRDNIRSRMRVAVKKILRKHGWPPDLEADAVQTVIRQAEAIAQNLR